ncbi:MAG TPA: CGNR zinc finger domain-containing protein [Actinomycetota bacterium]
MAERTSGSEAETVPGDRPPAPGGLELVQAFLNTSGNRLQGEQDRLDTPEEAVSWLTSHRLLDPGSTVSEQGCERLQAFREAVRSLVQAKPGSPIDAEILRLLNDAGDGGLRVIVDTRGRLSLEPIAWGVDGAMVQLLGLCHDAWLDGTWTRLKGCRRCGRAFYDRSKNRSGSWCSMSTCGNRTKNRTYRLRRSAGMST